MKLSRRQFAGIAGAGLVGRAQGAALTARQVVERIRQNTGAPWDDKSYRDTFKAGDPETPVTGISTTFMATLDVLQRSHAAGRNFVITHEPTFWSDADVTKDLLDDPIYRLKLDFVEKNKMIVWRFHDHIHARRPDTIFLGWNKAMGWDKYESAEKPRHYALPAAKLTTIARDMAKRLKTRSMRIIGDPELLVRSAALGSHELAANIKLLDEVDLLVVFEARERETAEYVRDTVASGQKKALILLSHEAGEEAGMDECAAWLRTVVREVHAAFLAAGDAFWLAG